MSRSARNPRIGSRRRRRTGESSEEEGLPSTSDSDFVIDVEEEAADDEVWEEVEEEEGLAAVLPQPPRDVARGSIGDRDRGRKRGRARRNKARRKDGEDRLRWEILEEENEKWLDNREMEEHVKNFDDLPLTGTMEPSADILLPLLRFQREWLAWALKQEEMDVRGGILADEMGMGKTIQAIALVLTARALRYHGIGDALNSNVASSSTSSLPRTKCTLVICPVVAVIQWVGEIDKHTKMGSARVLLHHGAKRHNNDINFNNYDFVLTTYSTIESDYRRHIMPPKQRCQWCDKLFYPKKLIIHLRYFCGPEAQKTEKQSKQVSKKKKKEKKKFAVTLKHVSSSVEDMKGKGKKKGSYQAREEEESSSSSEDDSGRGKKNSGSTKKPSEPEDNPDGAPRGKSVLHSVQWERIILDEVFIFNQRYVCLVMNIS